MHGVKGQGASRSVVTKARPAWNCFFFSHGSVMRLGANVWKIKIYLGEVVLRLMMLLNSWQTPL